MDWRKIGFTKNGHNKDRGKFIQSTWIQRFLTLCVRLSDDDVDFDGDNSGKSLCGPSRGNLL